MVIVRVFGAHGPKVCLGNVDSWLDDQTRGEDGAGPVEQVPYRGISGIAVRHVPLRTPVLSPPVQGGTVKTRDAWVRGRQQNIDVLRQPVLQICMAEVVTLRMQLRLTR